jgi:hypothetical protein
MTPHELRATLDRLDLSAAKAGHLLGVHRATIYRWLDGFMSVPIVVELLLAAGCTFDFLVILISGFPAVCVGPSQEAVAMGAACTGLDGGRASGCRNHRRRPRQAGDRYTYQ